jgi:hypothetical protein
MTMAGSFVSNLWGASGTTGQGRLTNLTLTFPPASTGSFSVNLTGTGVTITSVTNLPSWVSWSPTSSALTISSSATGPASATVTVNLSGGNASSTPLSLSLSTSPSQAGTASTVQIDANGWMLVQTLGANVAMQGLFLMIQEIPSGGRVQLDDPVLLIPAVASGNTDFRFSVGVGDGLGGGFISLTSPSEGNGVSIDGNTVTAQSALAPGSSATVTATYNGTPAATSTFTVQRLSSSSVTSGSRIDLALTSALVFTLTNIPPSVYLRGTRIQYRTIEDGTFRLMFYLATSNLQFSSPPISLTDPEHFRASHPNSGTAMITTTNREGQGQEETGFTIATNLGSLSDPTIINNPDPSPGSGER